MPSLEGMQLGVYLLWVGIATLFTVLALVNPSKKITPATIAFGMIAVSLWFGSAGFVHIDLPYAGTIPSNVVTDLKNLNASYSVSTAVYSYTWTSISEAYGGNYAIVYGHWFMGVVMLLFTSFDVWTFFTKSLGRERMET